MKIKTYTFLAAILSVIMLSAQESKAPAETKQGKAAVKQKRPSTERDQISERSDSSKTRIGTQQAPTDKESVRH